MTIDLGDNPVGTPPTLGEKEQIISVLGIDALLDEKASQVDHDNVALEVDTLISESLNKLDIDGGNLTDPGDKTLLKSSLGVTSYERAGLYDRFDDLTRYKDGATLTTGVTATRTGQPWHLRYTPGGVTGGARVVNGRLHLTRDSGYYLGANATLEDVTNWSMGVEFIKEATFLNASSTNNFTLAFGPPNIVLADGSGIQISGNPHINMNDAGINSVNMNFGQTNLSDAQGNAGTNIFTTVSPHGLENNDLVTISTVLTGAAGGVMPSGIPSTGGGGVGVNATVFSSASVYYVIKLSSNTFSIATTRDNVASGTAFPLGTSGTVLSFTRVAECLNRAYLNGVHSWTGPTVINYLVVRSGNTLVTSYTHSIFTGDAFMLEGSGLPAPLQERTVYYAIYNAARAIEVSATPGGSAIPLTSPGSANQLLRTVRRDLYASIPYGRKSIVTFRVKGDFFQVSLEGVGSVEYYYRNLAAKIPKDMSFYWQSPGASFLGTNYHSTYSATAIWVDAPQIEEQHTRRLPGWLATSGDGTTFTNRLNIIDSIKGSAHTLAVANLPSTKISVLAGASSIISLGGSVNGNVGGCFFADGNYIFNPGFTEFNNINQLAFCPGTVDAVIDTTVNSIAGSSSVALKGILTTPGLPVGSMEEIELCGYMTGTNAKRILLEIDTYGPTVFDSNVSGTPLDAVTVPWRIRILRKQTAATSHIMYSTMEYGGLVIGPQRATGNYTPDFRNLLIKLITADTNGLVLETIRKTVHPVKLR